jgi:hypothetical protein
MIPGLEASSAQGTSEVVRTFYGKKWEQQKTGGEKEKRKKEKNQTPTYQLLSI